MKTRIETVISYTRFNQEEARKTVQCQWEVIKKTFKNEKDADLFIHRISDNILVGKIWKQKNVIYDK